MQNQALVYAKNNSANALTALQELLRIPSVSALPEHRADMQKTAQWLADKCTEIGLQNAQILPTGSHPVVYADWLQAGPQAPTLLIYGHYDVQPVDPLDEWETPPFEPTVKGDDLFCRGASDNKGQFFAHLMAAAAYLQSSGALPLNIKFMLEGEEELGSPHLGDFVQQHQTLLQADAALISDTPILDPQTPVIVTGVRGLAYSEIFMRGSKHDLHSGSYGGVVENPLNAMVKVLAALHDSDGRVTVPGFYDDVQTLTPAERSVINNGAITDETVLTETGAPALWGEDGYSAAERIGVRPTLDIHGIKGGFIGNGQKTVIPAAASVKVSMRLVPHQNSQKIARQFEEYIYKLAPDTMETTVQALSGADSAVVDLSSMAIEAAAQAYQQGFGRKPLYVREGGTLPIVAMFGQILHTPVVMMGFGLPDDRLHAPNEKFHLPNFYRGIETAIHYYHIFSQARGQ
jgi:acetylornithine deacetylase/succinyl-diaminopimelate desuccinylase-like protein